MDRALATAALPVAAMRMKARKMAAQVEAGQAWDQDPLGWFEEYLGLPVYQAGGEPHPCLYPKQAEIIEAVCGNRRVSVMGGNSTGKDWTSARIALWWIHTHTPSKVVITAPTSRQVEKILWTELSYAYHQAKRPLGGRLYETPLLKYADDRFAMGFATNKDYQTTGFHSPHLLCILSEAQGLAESDITAIRRLNPERVIMTGNPLSEAGSFYDSHHSKADRWTTITINAFDTPNLIECRTVIPGLMTHEDVTSYAEDGEDTDFYRTTVLGEWGIEGGHNVIVPLSLAKAAEKAEYLPEGVEILGVDVARSGVDKTVIWSRRSRYARIIHRVRGADLMETTGFLADYHKQRERAHIVVDCVGIGAGIVDRLREQGIGCIAFNAGEAADDSGRFVNKGIESWWRMRQAYEIGLDTGPEPATVAQVSSRQWKRQSDRRIMFSKSKDDLRAAGLHSPDEADALAMTFAQRWMCLGGSKLTAGSDVDTDEDRRIEEEERKELGFGKPRQQMGPSVVTRNKPGSLSGYSPSRSRRR